MAHAKLPFDKMEAAKWMPPLKMGIFLSDLAFVATFHSLSLKLHKLVSVEKLIFYQF